MKMLEKCTGEITFRAIMAYLQPKSFHALRTSGPRGEPYVMVWERNEIEYLAWLQYGSCLVVAQRV